VFLRKWAAVLPYAASARISLDPRTASGDHCGSWRAGGRMVAPEDIASYAPDEGGWPRLWKAQRAFVSAEMLRQKGHYDCAANRYYYAVLHVAYHFVLGDKDTGQVRISHKDLTLAHIRGEDDEYRRQATVAVSRAQGARNQADYTPKPVKEESLEAVLSPVTDFMVRAFSRAGVPREAT